MSTSVDAATGSRRLAIIVGVLALVAAVGLVVSGGGRDRVVVLEVPAQDHVEPRVLADGTPVFVTRPEPDSVVVLEAFTTGPGPIGGMVGWCADGQRFVDPQLGLSFAPDGTRYSGRVPARVDRDRDTAGGLVQRDVEVGGDAVAGDPVRVSSPLPAPSVAVSVPLGSQQGHGPPMTCRLPSSRIGEEADPASLIGVVDHARLATRLRPALDGWQIVTGWIRVGPEGRQSWCDGFIVDRTLAVCNNSRDVPVALTIGPTAPGDVVTVIGDPLAVRIVDGTVVDAAVLPTSTWAGSSLVDTVTHRLGFLGIDPTGSRLLVADTDGLACVSGAPPRAGVARTVDVVYIDIDTRFDVRGSTERDALGRLDVLAAAGLAVDAVIDAVTCRLLTLRDSS